MPDTEREHLDLGHGAGARGRGALHPEIKHKKPHSCGHAYAHATSRPVLTQRAVLSTAWYQRTRVFATRSLYQERRGTEVQILRYQESDASTATGGHPTSYTWSCLTSKGLQCLDNTVPALLVDGPRLLLDTTLLTIGEYLFTIVIVKEPASIPSAIATRSPVLRSYRLRSCYGVSGTETVPPTRDPGKPRRLLPSG
eukprot:2779218-Rhodomonas_salina.5